MSPSVVFFRAREPKNEMRLLLKYIQLLRIGGMKTSVLDDYSIAMKKSFQNAGLQVRAVCM